MRSRRVLADADIDRLVKVLGLIGSTHDGEALAAARMAHRMLRELGLTWREVLLPDSEDRGWRGQLGEVLAHPEPLTDWERNFARDLRAFLNLSERQAAVLDGLLCKVRAYRSSEAA